MKTRTFIAACAITLASCPTFAQTDLAGGFLSPPAAARPHTWWHWMNGNITREGITADLEAMKKIGLGGAQIFNVSESIPKGPIEYMSPQWRDLFKFAASEADRLGIELCMHNCAGWSSSGGPWITPEHAMQRVTTSEIAVAGGKHFEAALPAPPSREKYYKDIAILAFPTPKDNAYRIKDLKAKVGDDYRYGQQPSLDAVPADAVIKRETMIDLTAKVGADGRLTWDAPAGAWTVLRIGYTPTGAHNAPSPDSGRGLECDKLSRDGLDAHWAGGLAPLLKDLGPLAGKSLNNCLIDSYEMGGQNWTPRMREEFTKRRGYDPLMLLPTLAGRVVDSGEVTERFLWDLRRTIGDLFADNYYSYFAELCHKNGLRASIEPYDGPFECLLSGRDADIPMGEFWVGGDESSSCKLAASVAHTYGRQIVGAESFTAVPDVGRWLNHPASLKGVGDLMYTVGINRFIIHRYAHQPWLDKFPGMTMGQWGTHFERTTTWWDQGAAWVSYMTRCEYLLQQGRFVADVCFLDGDAAPNDARHDPALKAAGYDYDGCSVDVLFNRMTVKEGRLTLPDGMSYRALVLPESTFMTPRTLARVRELVTAGATVIGPRPSKSPSLSGFPACDAELAKIAADVWGGADGKTVKEHALGKGRVLCGQTPAEALAGARVAPDCAFENAGGRLAWIHRVVDGADIYFVSSQAGRSQDCDAIFRVGGRAPELWHADSGLIEAAPLWSESGGRTRVSLHFEPVGSVFVVFRSPASSPHFASVKPPQAAAAAAQPRVEIRKAVYEATDGAGGTDVTEKVAAMVRAGQMSIAATNGNFGDPTYNHVKRLRVEFTIDGKAMTRSAAENSLLVFVEPGPDAPATWSIAIARDGAQLRAFRAGTYEVRRDAGDPIAVEIKPLPEPLNIAGPWTVKFPPNWGAPASITLDKLVSWPEHADAGVKYFSGTAEYETQFDIAPGLLGGNRILSLDLGAVGVIAEVKLNDQDLGTWWKPPFSADITAAARPGRNTLRVRVTNLWVNRLIGDEQEPADVEWNGKPIKEWPKWLTDHTPRPSKRLTFTTWHHWTKSDTPIDSGLIGPVVIRAGQQADLR